MKTKKSKKLGIKKIPKTSLKAITGGTELPKRGLLCQYEGGSVDTKKP